MKTKRLIESLISPSSSGRTTAITVLIGGLAVGAVLGVLFATETGKAARQKIRDAFSSLFDREDEDQRSEPAPHTTQQHYAVKRPKSDIRSVIHNAHAGAAQTE